MPSIVTSEIPKTGLSRQILGMIYLGLMVMNKSESHLLESGHSLWPYLIDPWIPVFTALLVKHKIVSAKKNSFFCV